MSRQTYIVPITEAQLAWLERTLPKAPCSDVIEEKRVRYLIAALRDGSHVEFKAVAQ